MEPRDFTKFTQEDNEKWLYKELSAHTDRMAESVWKNLWGQH